MQEPKEPGETYPRTSPDEVGLPEHLGLCPLNLKGWEQLYKSIVLTKYCSDIASNWY
jgi:hypothetical protein